MEVRDWIQERLGSMYCLRCGKALRQPTLGMCPYCGENLPTMPVTGSGTSVYIGSGSRWPNEPSRVGSFTFIASASAGFASYYSGARANLDSLKLVLSDRSLLEPLEKNIELMKTEQEALAHKTQEVVSAQAAEVKTLRSEAEAISERGQLANRIVELMTNCNLMIGRLIPDFRMFRTDVEIVNELHKPCSGQDSFSVKRGALAGLFEVELDPIRKALRNPDPTWKSIKLVEEWMVSKGFADMNDLTEVWRNVVELRNAAFPYHETDSRILDVIKYFGGSFPIDYRAFWAGILRKFMESLEKLQSLLATLV
jgi:hypothetical protein